MSQPIYKLFLFSPAPASYQISEEEQQKMMAKVNEARAKVGGEVVVTCASGWATEQWQYWGVEKFPSLEAVLEHGKLLVEMGWFQYIKSETYLGIPTQ